MLERDKGRWLSWSDHGPRDGKPVLFLHGIPGSRMAPAGLASQASALGLRLISPDRPGYGDSTPAGHYGLADHTSDLLALADHLELERFSVLGFSGGGIFALACAQRAASRIDNLVVVGMPAIPLMEDPFSHGGELSAGTWRLGRDNPDALPAQLEPLLTDAESLCDAMHQAMSADDTALLSEPLRTAYLEEIKAALAQGAQIAALSFARDIALMANEWPFEAGQIKHKVHVVHGLHDNLVFPEHARCLANHLPDCELSLPGAAGHYTALTAPETLQLLTQ